MNQPKRAANKYKPPEIKNTIPGQSYKAAVSYFNAEEGAKSTIAPEARHPTIGSVNHNGILLSRLFCTIGFVIISSTKCIVRES
jgi:hypothetical protein